MSKTSKVKRVTRKKKEPQRPIRRLGQSLQPHAQLTDADGHSLGGAGYRDRQWLMVLDGQVVARTDSAAMMIAMLKHVAAVRERAGHTAQLNCSPAMQAVATREAAAEGKSLDEYLQMLEQERQERLQPDADAPKGPLH